MPMVLQDQSVHALQEVIDGIDVDQLKSLDMGLGIS